MRKKGSTPIPTKGLPCASKNLPPKKIAIDVHCKKYAMILACDVNRPKKKPTRGRTSKSKSRTPAKPEVNSKDPTPKMQKEHTKPLKSERAGPSKKKESEVLGALNEIPKSTKEVATRTIKRVKRKRFVEENDIAAENIPLEAVFPVLQFGLNKDICPKKRRRLQSLISPNCC